MQGVIRPDIGNPESLILDFIDSPRHGPQGPGGGHLGLARAGPRLASSRANLPVGEVTRASIVEQEASQQVRLRPYADLANLDIVQVLTGGPRR